MVEAEGEGHNHEKKKKNYHGKKDFQELMPTLNLPWIRPFCQLSFFSFVSFSTNDTKMFNISRSMLGVILINRVMYIYIYIVCDYFNIQQKLATNLFFQSKLNRQNICVSKHSCISIYNQDFCRSFVARRSSNLLTLSIKCGSRSNLTQILKFGQVHFLGNTKDPTFCSTNVQLLPSFVIKKNKK